MGAKYAGRKPRRPAEGGRARGNPLTTTPDYDADEVEFLKAMDHLKKKKPFPTWSEALAVLKGLGWKKVPPAEGDTRAG